MAFDWSRAVRESGAGGLSLVCAIVAVQIVTAVAVVCLMALIAVEQAAAAALGAGVSIAPTALLALAAEAKPAVPVARAARRFLFYGVARSMATVALMALVLVAVGPEPLGFFVALATVHLAYVVVPAVHS